MVFAAAPPQPRFAWERIGQRFADDEKAREERPCEPAGVKRDGAQESFIRPAEVAPGTADERDGREPRRADVPFEDGSEQIFVEEDGGSGGVSAAACYEPNRVPRPRSAQRVLARSQPVARDRSRDSLHFFCFREEERGGRLRRMCHAVSDCARRSCDTTRAPRARLGRTCN